MIYKMMNKKVTNKTSRTNKIIQNRRCCPNISKDNRINNNKDRISSNNKCKKINNKKLVIITIVINLIDNGMTDKKKNLWTSIFKINTGPSMIKWCIFLQFKEGLEFLVTIYMKNIGFPLTIVITITIIIIMVKNNKYLIYLFIYNGQCLNKMIL